MAHHSSRPVWLTEPCPPWCADDHARQVIPDDRSHTSDLVDVPVIALERHRNAEAQIVRCAVTSDLLLAISRRVGEAETWVSIGADGGQLDITAESARRLWRKLADLLGELDRATTRSPA